MKEENRVVNALWVGKALGEMEQLTLHSFVAHGHEVKLWVYEPLPHGLPKGVFLADANQIIPENKVFHYSEDGPLAWSRGSVAGFSDIFRYKLLHDRGGWWIDMDVTCLQPFDFEEPYFFRSHWKFPIIGNVMKCPAGSPLMARCYERASASVNAQNDDWDKPIRILNEEVEAFGLMKFRKIGLFNTDQAEMLKIFYDVNSPFSRDWIGVHWCRTSGNFEYVKDGRVWLLLTHYGIIPSE
ncbi:MAG: hypothetical protein H6581_23085 [Bacteroidia bacterium]|nr:hypothetical protein [Bacteroidia bacterium]